MTRSPRVRAPGRWLLIGVLLALLVSTAALALVLRTDWGRERVLAFTLRTLGGRIDGIIQVDRVAGNLLTGAKLYTVSVTDPEGRPLVVADSVYIDYRLATFLGGDILLRRVQVFDAELTIERFPGDTLWNYQRILLDPTPDPLAEPNATLIERLVLHEVDVTVRLPWEPDEELLGVARERAIQETLGGLDRLMVEEVPGGFLRTMLMYVASGDVTELFIGPDVRGGTFLRVEAAAGEVRVYREPPLIVRDLQGELGLLEGLVRYQAPRIVLPNSVAASIGTIDLREEAPVYDIVVTGERIDLADMQWLYPALPDVGDGDIDFRLRTRPDEFLMLARRLRLETPDTRIVGTFGVILGDTVRFLDVDLVADPLDVRTVEQMLPDGLPVTGLTIGTAEFRGAAS